MHLPAQHVEVVRRAGDVAHLDVVVGAQLQEALEPRRGVLGALAFVAVRQQQHEAVGAQPLGLARGDVLVDDDLRAVGEVAELRFPQHQRLGIGAGEAVFEAEHAVFGQRAVVDLELAVRQRRTAGCTCARSFWSTQIAWRWLKVPRPESWPDRRTPKPSVTRLPNASASAVAQSKPSPLSNIVALGVDHAAERLVDRQVVGDRGQRAAEAVEQLAVDRGRRRCAARSRDRPACAARSSARRTSRPRWACSSCRPRTRLRAARRTRRASCGAAWRRSRPRRSAARHRPR